MNTRNLLTLIAFGGVVALVACSSSEADKFGSSDSFCSARADAECAQLAPKCGATVDACKQKRMSTCTAANSMAASLGGSYVSSAAQDCIDKINEVYKDKATNVTPDGEADVAKVCGRVFRGSKAANTPCANTIECSGALICDRTVCAAEDITKVSAACNNPGQVCEKGAYCQQQGAVKFCVTKKALNESCTADSPCVESARCVNMCVALVAAGGACNMDADCAPEAPYCDQTSSPKKCRPKYESTSPACRDFGVL
jgi:hypothetical protein